MRQGNVSTMSNATFVAPYPLPLCATAVLVPASSEMISNDKLPSCENGILKLKSSETLVQDATLHGKGYAPYYSAFSQAISSRLWLPTETVWHALAANSSSIWLSKTVGQSWFSTRLYIAPRPNLPRIFSPSSPSSPVGCTDSENTVRKSRKIRCSASPVQRHILKRWCGAARFVYNRAVEHLKQPDTKANWKKIKGVILASLPAWCAEIPYQIKSIALRDACKATTQVKILTQQGKRQDDGSLLQVHLRSRHDPIQSFYVPQSAVSERGIYHTLLGTLRFRDMLPAQPRAGRLVGACGAYSLTVPRDEPRRVAENQGRVVALDPGIRSFLTFFAEDSCGGLGAGDFSRIQRLCTHLDRLHSRADTSPSHAKARWLKAAARLRRTIRHLIDELHHKAALFLVTNFDVILLPTFETSQMVCQGARKLRRKSVRNMRTFAHYRFKSFLKHKAFEYGKVVIDVCEAYTSKTVSWTGEIIERLGGRKVIRSKEDGQRMDRDLHGARGIMLRALEDTPLVRDLLVPCIVNER